MKGTACIRHGRIKAFMWCDAIILWTNFAGGNSKAKEAHCACKGHAREIQWLFLARNDFNGWLVRGKWTSHPGYLYKGWLLQLAQKTKARFTNLIENKIVPPCPPPSPSWGASKHNSVFLLSFQSSETLKQYLDHYFAQRGLSFYFQ